MDSKVKLYIERAENEITFAKASFMLSSEERIKQELFIPKEMTFYSHVISHAYYCIFYCAKSILLKHGVETYPPDEHRKTLDEFEARLVKTGILDYELLNIYKSLIVKADELLAIFSQEKKKRGEFTYHRLPQANVKPSEESVRNAEKFFKNIYAVIQK